MMNINIDNICFGVIILYKMDINAYTKSLKNKRDGQSYSFLAERVPTSSDAPYRIATLNSPIKPEDAVVVGFGGYGGGANIEGHNWFIKYITNFIRTKPELNNARVCVAICDWGEKYPEIIARFAYNTQKYHPYMWNIMKKMKCPITKMATDIYAPAAAEDIFNNIILPKIKDSNGNNFSLHQILKNLRGITVVAYCAGGHTAMYLEDYMVKKMTDMGYPMKDIKMALNQIVVIGYAMSCPYSKSNMRFINFGSVSDSGVRSTPLASYLFFMGGDFGLLHAKHKNNDTFLCTQISKVGIEGNPNILHAMPIEEYMKKNEEECSEEHQESESDLFNEHTFIGFVAKKGFSNGAKNLQQLFKTVIVNTVDNSIKNSERKVFTPLPNMVDLVGTDVDIYGRANLAYIKQRTLYDFAAMDWQIIYKCKQAMKLHFMNRCLKGK